MTSVSALRPSAVQSGTIMWQPGQGYLPVGSKVLLSLNWVGFVTVITISFVHKDK